MDRSGRRSQPDVLGHQGEEADRGQNNAVGRPADLADLMLFYCECAGAPVRSPNGRRGPTETWTTASKTTSPVYLTLRDRRLRQHAAPAELTGDRRGHHPAVAARRKRFVTLGPHVPLARGQSAPRALYTDRRPTPCRTLTNASDDVPTPTRQRKTGRSIRPLRQPLATSSTPPSAAAWSCAGLGV